MLNQSGVFKGWAGVLEMQQYQRFDRMKKARWAAGFQKIRTLKWISCR
jgi:hypothetical protein